MVFVFPVYPRVKVKENEKKAKNLDLARELKTFRNMKVTVILIDISGPGFDL